MISVYGPRNELMADYVKEPGQLGTTRKVTMDYILGGEAIAKRGGIGSKRTHKQKSVCYPIVT